MKPIVLLVFASFAFSISADAQNVRARAYQKSSYRLQSSKARQYSKSRTAIRTRTQNRQTRLRSVGGGSLKGTRIRSIARSQNKRKISRAGQTRLRTSATGGARSSRYASKSYSRQQRLRSRIPKRSTIRPRSFVRRR